MNMMIDRHIYGVVDIDIRFMICYQRTLILLYIWRYNVTTHTWFENNGEFVQGATG